MTTETLYAGTLPLLEKQGSNWTAAYAWGSGQIRRNGEYPLTDAHGSSRTLTDANQGVTGTADYAAFGQAAGTTGTSAEPYLYAGAWGYRSDGDAGLMLLGARYYDAQAGRFVTRDTLLSEHPYLYCEHEPVGSVDPSGHMAAELAGTLTAAGGVAAVPVLGWVAAGALLVGGAAWVGWEWWQSRPRPPYGGSGPAKWHDPPTNIRQTRAREWKAPHRGFEIPPWWGNTPSPNDPESIWIIYLAMKLWEANSGP